jgi:hypothetical protein
MGGTEENPDISARIAGIWPEILTRDLQNIKQE